jgi:hypothetical protein
MKIPDARVRRRPPNRLRPPEQRLKIKAELREGEYEHGFKG